MLNDEFMTTYEGFRNTVRGKINELSDDIYIIQTAGLSFSSEITNTFEQSKQFLDSIETKLNPNYKSSWSNNQQMILNQISNNFNNGNNKSKNNWDEEQISNSDDEMSEEDLD